MSDITSVESGARFGGSRVVECWRLRDPETGKRIRDERGRFLPRYLAWTDVSHNIITNEGLDAALDIMFHGATQITTWYCVMFESDTTPASGHTYATPVYTELETYDEGTRPEYVEAAASGQSMTNSANKATFTISATKTLYGAALVGGGTDPTVKGDAAGGGTLYCSGTFASSRNVIDDDVVNLSYTLTSADDA